MSLPPAGPPPGTALPAAAAQARIRHLFRAARREGRIHPLQHLIERYRAQMGAASATAPDPAP